MKVLIDTNIILEVILAQAQAQSARALLAAHNDHEFFITDFSIHSIGLLLLRRKQVAAFDAFLNDMMNGLRIAIIALSLADLLSVSEQTKLHKLDFDDAYQHVTAEKYNLTLVSFDADFDRTPRGRKTPTEIMAG